MKQLFQGLSFLLPFSALILDLVADCPAVGYEVPPVHCCFLLLTANSDTWRAAARWEAGWWGGGAPREPVLKLHLRGNHTLFV